MQIFSENDNLTFYYSKRNNKNKRFLCFFNRNKCIKCPDIVKQWQKIIPHSNACKTIVWRGYKDTDHLHHFLAKNPNIFAELIKLGYKFTEGYFVNITNFSKVVSKLENCLEIENSYKAL